MDNNEWAALSNDTRQRVITRLLVRWIGARSLGVRAVHDAMMDAYSVGRIIADSPAVMRTDYGTARSLALWTVQARGIGGNKRSVEAEIQSAALEVLRD